MASIHCENPETVARAMEALGRVAAGMALEGHNVAVNIVQIPEDDE
jgi:hypothetical protein